MHRFMIPYLSADDIVNDARRRQAELFAEMLRREDALPLPPEPEPVPLPDRVPVARPFVAGGSFVWSTARETARCGQTSTMWESGASPRAT